MGKCSSVNSNNCCSVEHTVDKLGVFVYVCEQRLEAERLTREEAERQEAERQAKLIKDEEEKLERKKVFLMFSFFHI